MTPTPPTVSAQPFKPYELFYRVRESDLEPPDRHLLNAIGFRAFDNGEVIVDYEQLHADTGWGDSKIRHTIAAFQKLGILVRVRRWRFRIELEAIPRRQAGAAGGTGGQAPGANERHQEPESGARNQKVAPRASSTGPEMAPGARKRHQEPESGTTCQNLAPGAAEIDRSDLPDRSEGERPPPLPPPDPDGLVTAAARAREQMWLSQVRRPEAWAGLEGDALRSAQLATDGALVEVLRSMEPPATPAELHRAVMAFVKARPRWWPSPGVFTHAIELERFDLAQRQEVQLPLPEPLPEDLEPPDPPQAPQHQPESPPEHPTGFSGFRVAQARRAAKAAEQAP